MKLEEIKIESLYKTTLNTIYNFSCATSYIACIQRSTLYFVLRSTQKNLIKDGWYTYPTIIPIINEK